MTYVLQPGEMHDVVGHSSIIRHPLNLDPNGRPHIRDVIDFVDIGARVLIVCDGASLRADNHSRYALVLFLSDVGARFGWILKHKLHPSFD